MKGPDLKGYRDVLGLSLRQLELVLGTSRQVLHDLERGKTEITEEQDVYFTRCLVEYVDLRIVSHQDIRKKLTNCQFVK